MDVTEHSSYKIMESRFTELPKQKVCQRVVKGPRYDPETHLHRWYCLGFNEEKLSINSLEVWYTYRTLACPATLSGKEIGMGVTHSGGCSCDHETRLHLLYGRPQVTQEQNKEVELPMPSRT